MAVQEPRDHHYAPQSFLRAFAVDEGRKRVTTVAKHGSTTGIPDSYVLIHDGENDSVATDDTREIHPVREHKQMAGERI